MATGPEHYAEAERLLSIQVSLDPEDQGAVIALRLAAQTHATLALAAATVATRMLGPQEPWGGHTLDAAAEWREVTTTTPAPERTSIRP